MLKAAQSFELNWCHHMTILCFFLCSRQHERCSNFDILHNKCPARLTNISSNLDTDILPPWPHGGGAQSNGIDWLYCILSSLLCFSVYHPFSFSHKSIHAIPQRQWVVFQSISPPQALAPLLWLLNQKRKAIEGLEQERARHVFPLHGPHGYWGGDEE